MTHLPYIQDCNLMFAEFAPLHSGLLANSRPKPLLFNGPNSRDTHTLLERRFDYRQTSEKAGLWILELLRRCHRAAKVALRQNRQFLSILNDHRSELAI